MLLVTERLTESDEAQVSLTLSYEDRKKFRLRTRLDNGEEVGLQLNRQGVLRGGDRLRAVNGLVIQIRASDEAVSTVYCDDALLMARACYHLGNRHVPLQIGAHWLRYQQDHVLDDMVRQLGLEVSHELAPFEPESGAYHEHGAHHHHHHHHHAHD